MAKVSHGNEGMTEMERWRAANPITVWLTDAHMTQQELAVRCGVSRQAVFGWQTGTIGVGDAAMQKLSRVMDTYPEDLATALKQWKERIPAR